MLTLYPFRIPVPHSFIYAHYTHFSHRQTPHPIQTNTTQKRNIVAVHIATYLAQKKQRKTIGDVHLRNDNDGDSRKTSLILTPPVPSNADTPPPKKHSKETPTKPQKQRKLFPNRCNNKFITRAAPTQPHDPVIQTNRGTPSYNNALANDLNLVSTSLILADTASDGSKTSFDNSSSSTLDSGDVMMHTFESIWTTSISLRLPRPNRNLFISGETTLQI